MDEQKAQQASATAADAVQETLALIASTRQSVRSPSPCSYIASFSVCQRSGLVLKAISTAYLHHCVNSNVGARTDQKLAWC